MSYRIDRFRHKHFSAKNFLLKNIFYFVGLGDVVPLQDLIRSNRKLKNRLEFQEAKCSWYMRHYTKKKKDVRSANRRIQQVEANYQSQLSELLRKISALEKNMSP